MSIEAFVQRLKEAIETSSSSQGTIADYCNVSRQSVTNWKTTGQISRDNLKKLSEVTGFRFIWLKEGIGPKRFTDQAENQAEMFKDEYGVRERGLDYPDPDPAEELAQSIRYALANRRISQESLELLKKFFNSLVDVK